MPLQGLFVFHFSKLWFLFFSKSQNSVFSEKVLALCGFNSSDRNHSVVLMFALSPFVFPKNKLKHIGYLCCCLVILHVYMYLLKCLLNWNGFFLLKISVSILRPSMKIHIFLLRFISAITWFYKTQAYFGFIREDRKKS